MESQPLLASECPVRAVCPRTPRGLCTLSAVWRPPALLSPHRAPVSAPLHPVPRSSRGRKPLQPILMPSLSSFREPSVFSLL